MLHQFPRETSQKEKEKETKKKTWLSIRGRKEGKTFDFMKLCWQNCNQKTNVIIIMYDFWELWRNISADKRRHNSRKHENERPTQTITCSHNWFLINREILQELCLWVLFFYSTTNSLTFTYFRAFVFSIFSSLITSLIFFYSPQKLLKSPDLSSIYWTRFFFKTVQHCETWNVIVLFLSYNLEEIELTQFFRSCINEIFLHHVCMNSLNYLYE